MEFIDGTDETRLENAISLLELPPEIIHFIMFHLDLGEVIRLLFVCRTLKDLIEKHSNNFWYIKYQVTCPFEWLHRLQYCNRVFQEEKRQSSCKDPGYMMLQELGMALLVSQTSKIPASAMKSEGHWKIFKEDDYNPTHYNYLNPVKIYWSISNRRTKKQLQFPEPSTNICKELQFRDSPEVLYLVKKADVKSDWDRKKQKYIDHMVGNPPTISISRYLPFGRYMISWRIAVDETAAVGDIRLQVFNRTNPYSEHALRASVINQNEVKLMKGKGWFVFTMPDHFEVHENIDEFVHLEKQREIKISLEGDKDLSGIWVDWVRIVNKDNKMMTNYLKKERSNELTIQKMQEKAKKSRRK
eukprot:CAMPEP_0168559408 /NCGR_PEP_ID=MMETSP0413-20121227/10507_1 /TAXON_ID=136452 /ORGANISM="Filamoeba nolandi, Strain NC-AS-23-1" /LENGTH=356 /DNA_ID=CAMNT_0008590633 /DNA_START=12 /DNA_END=1082 /DNA_ORIENTATION=+